MNITPKFRALACLAESVKELGQGVATCNRLCSAAAWIIASASDDVEQTRLMDYATDCGFTCEFYASGNIRVHWRH